MSMITGGSVNTQLGIRYCCADLIFFFRYIYKLLCAQQSYICSLEYDTCVLNTHIQTHTHTLTYEHPSCCKLTSYICRWFCFVVWKYHHELRKKKKKLRGRFVVMQLGYWYWYNTGDCAWSRRSNFCQNKIVTVEKSICAKFTIFIS